MKLSTRLRRVLVRNAATEQELNRAIKEALKATKAERLEDAPAAMKQAMREVWEIYAPMEWQDTETCPFRVKVGNRPLSPLPELEFRPQELVFFLSNVEKLSQLHPLMMEAKQRWCGWRSFVTSRVPSEMKIAVPAFVNRPCLFVTGTKEIAGKNPGSSPGDYLIYPVARVGARQFLEFEAFSGNRAASPKFTAPWAELGKAVVDLALAASTEAGAGNAMGFRTANLEKMAQATDTIHGIYLDVASKLKSQTAQRTLGELKLLKNPYEPLAEMVSRTKLPFHGFAGNGMGIFRIPDALDKAMKFERDL